jgi:hypothetical protein
MRSVFQDLQAKNYIIQAHLPRAAWDLFQKKLINWFSVMNWQPVNSSTVLKSRKKCTFKKNGCKISWRLLTTQYARSPIKKTSRSLPKRLSATLPDIIGNHQHGFMEGKGIKEPALLFTHPKQGTQLNLSSLRLMSFDIEKASDRIGRAVVIQAL